MRNSLLISTALLALASPAQADGVWNGQAWFEFPSIVGDGRKTCSAVVEHSTQWRTVCHTFDEWKYLTRAWCGAAHKIVVRYKKEQGAGWGTNGMLGTPQSAAISRDLNLMFDIGGACNSLVMSVITAAKDNNNGEYPQ